MLTLGLYLAAGVAAAVALDLYPEGKDHKGICFTACAACIVLWPIVLIALVLDTLWDLVLDVFDWGGRD